MRAPALKVRRFKYAHENVWIHSGRLDMEHVPVIRESKYWIFLTHWGFIVITVALCLDAILVLIRFGFEKSHRQNLQVKKV